MFADSGKGKFLAALVLLIILCGTKFCEIHSQTTHELRKLNAEIDKILEADNYPDIAEYLQQQHKLADELIRRKDQISSYAFKKLVNLYSGYIYTKHAIRKRQVFLTGDIIDEIYGEKFVGAPEVNRNRDEKSARLFYTRCYVRGKVTIVRFTALIWARINHLAEEYKHSSPEFDALFNAIRANESDEPLTVDAELKRQAIAREDLGDMTDGMSTEQLYDHIDDYIDKYFECHQERPTNAVAEWTRAAPLADKETVYKWIGWYISQELLDQVREGEKLVAKHLPDWDPLSGKSTQNLLLLTEKGENPPSMGYLTYPVTQKATELPQLGWKSEPKPREQQQQQQEGAIKQLGWTDDLPSNTGKAKGTLLKLPWKSSANQELAQKPEQKKPQLQEVKQLGWLDEQLPSENRIVVKSDAPSATYKPTEDSKGSSGKNGWSKKISKQLNKITSYKPDMPKMTLASLGKRLKGTSTESKRKSAKIAAPLIGWYPD